MTLPECTEDDKTGLIRAMEEWGNAFSADDPGRILSLYADDAVLWGTLSPARRDSPAAIRDYFECAFSFSERRVRFDDPLIRVYGEVAINTGPYTFSWVKDGRGERILARYSFTYAKCDGCWLILDHHSSLMPTPGVLT